MNAQKKEIQNPRRRSTKDRSTMEDSRRWDKFLATARRMMSETEYGKSLSYFAYVIHHAPQLRDEVHDDFLFALKSWCSVLEEHGKMEDLVNCLNEARKLFPDSAEIANNIGSALFRLNLFDEAAVYFRRALTIDPSLSGAQENLDSLANLLVERWHFRMLNDQCRNQAYKNAIYRAVKEGCDQVLDIGSGTGILSMYAALAGAKEVYACEMSKTMFDLSSDIVKSNGMQDSIRIINKKSCDLKIPDDLPIRVSLIVTETLDCGLLGEGILGTLAHAQRELMKLGSEVKYDIRDRETSKERGGGKVMTKVIPEGATVYGRIIQSEKIREYSRVKPKILELDLSCVDIRGAEFSEKTEEPYTTEEMSCTEHTSLSEPFQVMTYDFRTPEKYTADSKVQIEVPVNNSGSIDAVMTWFELKLDSFETISSAPGCSICWEQAVYPLGIGSCESRVETGDVAVLNCILTSGAILLEIDHVVKRRSIEKTKDQRPAQNYVLPFTEVNMLNDVRLNECFQGAIIEAFSEIHCAHGQTEDVRSGNYSCIVLSDSPSFNSLFASAAGFSPVLCVSAKSDFASCLEMLRADNQFPDTIHFTDSKLEELTKTGEWQAMVVDPVEASGVLRRQILEDIVFAKGCILSKETGVVLPGKMELWGMLISSESLCRKSHVVGNDVTLGLNIARYMNAFQVKNQVDVDVNSNPYVALTQPNRLLTWDFTVPTNDDSLLSLLDMTSEVHVNAEKTGYVDGFMYWFVLVFSEDLALSTGPDSSSHFNQVVIVFNKKLAISCGEELVITSSCKDSCVTASVKCSSASHHNS